MLDGKRMETVAPDRADSGQMPGVGDGNKKASRENEGSAEMPVQKVPDGCESETTPLTFAISEENADATVTIPFKKRWRTENSTETVCGDPDRSQTQSSVHVEKDGSCSKPDGVGIGPSGYVSSRFSTTGGQPILTEASNGSDNSTASGTKHSKVDSDLASTTGSTTEPKKGGFPEHSGNVSVKPQLWYKIPVCGNPFYSSVQPPTYSSDEDSEDEDALHIDEDRVTEISDSNEQAEGSEQNKTLCQPEHLESPLLPEQTESTVPSQQTEESAQQAERNNVALAPHLTETVLQSEQACATQSERNGNRTQSEQTKAMLQQTSQMLKDQKMKLGKFKEINKSWLERKHDLSLEKSDKLQSTQLGTNMFAALNASSSPASNSNAYEDASTKIATDITDGNHKEGEAVSTSFDQADTPGADGEQMIKTSEILTARTNSKEPVTSVENTSSLTYSKTHSTLISTVTARSNYSLSNEKQMKRNTSETKRLRTESLLDLLNKSGDQQGSSVKRTPQKPTEVNWPDYGVKRCWRCNFMSSDETLLQVHTCKRSTSTSSSPSTSSRASTSSDTIITTTQSIFSLGSSGKSFFTAPVQGMSSPRSFAASNNSSSVDPCRGSPADHPVGEKYSRNKIVSVLAKKHKIPPPFPKVWKDIKCRILCLENNLFYCTICNHKAEFPLFIGHLLEHMVEYPYTCPHCSKPGTLLFQRSVDITTHINNTHSNVSHRFTMFKFSSAKEILDKVSRTGAETLSGIYVNPKIIVEGAINIQTTTALSSSSLQSLASQLATPALMSPALNGLSHASTSLDPTLTSVADSASASFTQPISVRLPTNITPASVSHDLTPATVLAQVSKSNTLNTLIPASVVTGNQIVAPPTLGFRPDIQRNTVTAASDVIIPVAPTGNPLFVSAQGSAASTSVIQNITALPAQPRIHKKGYTELGASNVAASEKENNPPPVEKFPLNSVQKDLSTEKSHLSKQTFIPVVNCLRDSSSTSDDAQHSPNILSRKKSEKSVTVTEGRQPDIWRHLHEDSIPCKYFKSPQAQTSWPGCQFEEGIITSMPIVSSISNNPISNQSANKSVRPGSTCRSSLDSRDSSLKSKTKAGTIESSNNHVKRGNEDSEIDCEMIRHLDKPVPILHTDLTEPSDGEMYTTVEALFDGNTHKTAEAPFGGETHKTGEPSSDGATHKTGEPTSGGETHITGEPTSGGETHKTGEPTSGGETHKTGEPTSGGETHTTGEPTSGGKTHTTAESTSGGEMHTITDPPHRKTCATAEEPSGCDKNMGTAGEQMIGDNSTELLNQSSYSLSPKGDATLAQNDKPPTPQQQSEVGHSEKDSPCLLNTSPPEFSTPRPVSNNAERGSMFYVCGFTDCMFSCIMSEQFKHHLLINHRGAKQYPCAHCGHKSPGEEPLVRHMRSHTTAKMFLLFMCGFSRCGFGTNLISEFRKHNDIFHKNSNSYRCAMCKTDYQSPSELSNHMQLSVLTVFQCPYCSAKTKDKRLTLRHITESHPDKPRPIKVRSHLVCRTINQEKIQSSLESRRNSKGADNHSARTSDRGKEINLIGAEHTSQAGRETENYNTSKDTASVEKVNVEASSQLDAHGLVSSAEGVQRFQCVFCSHIGPHEITIYNCRCCKFNTSEYIQMEVHMQSSHPNQLQCYKSTTKATVSKEFKCQVCPYSTSCPVEREKHFTTHEVVQVVTDIPSLHSATAAKPNKFTCPECKQNFECYPALEEHIRRRHAEVTHITLFMCQICRFSSTALHVTGAHFCRAYPGMAKILRLKHKISNRLEATQTTAEDPELDFSVHWFHCDYCKFSSSLREDLEQHLNSHSPITENDKTENGHSESGGVEPTADTFSIPSGNIFKSNIKCPHCEYYSSSSRVNLLRHIKHHKLASPSGSDGDRLKGLPWKVPSPLKDIAKQNVLTTGNGTDSSPSPQKKNSSTNKPHTLSPRKKQTPKKTSSILPSSPRRGKYDINPSGSTSKSGQPFYRCRRCHFKAANVQDLYSHLRCHKSLPNHKCSYGNFKSTNKAVVMNHQRKQHVNSANKREEPSNLSSKSPGSLPLTHDTDYLSGRKRKLSGKSDTPSKSDSPSKRIKVNAHGTPYYECVVDKCGFKTDTINALEEHFKTSHQFNVFRCKHCKFQTLRLLVMEKHLECRTRRLYLANIHKQKQMVYTIPTDTEPKGTTNSESITPGKGTSNMSSPSKSPIRRTPVKSKTLSKAMESDDGAQSKEHFKCGLCSSNMCSHSTLKEAQQHKMACLKAVLEESELIAADEQAKQASHPVVDSPQTCAEAPGEMAEDNLGSPEAVETKAADEPVKPLESSGSQDWQTKKKFRSPKTFTYFCHLCEHTDSSRKGMKEHYFVHYRYYPFKCVYCPKFSASGDCLQRHTIQAHPDKVVDSKMRRNEQMDLKIGRLLRQNRKLTPREELGIKDNTVNSEANVGSAENQNRHVVVETPSRASKSKESALQSVKEYDPADPFHCELCKFTTRSQTSLQKHMLRHDAPRLKCGKCDHIGFSPHLMCRHYQRSHPGEKINITRILQDDSSAKPRESYIFSKATGSGQKRKAGEETVDSTDFTIIADEDSESKILALMPLQHLYCKFPEQSNKTTYKCLMCDLEVPTRCLITAHIYEHMPKCFQCFYCSFRSYPSSAVTSHMRKSHDGQPRKFKFFKEKALEKYNQMLSKLGKLSFQTSEPNSKKPKLSPEKQKNEEDEIKASECDSCVTEQSGNKQAPDHENPRASGITNFCCHLCAFKVRDQKLFAEHLSFHKILMTSGNNQEIAKCGFCSFSSNNTKQFNEHVSRHVCERPYKCLHCEYSSFSKSHMRSHIKLKHPGQKISYSDNSTDRTVLVPETTPVETPRINLDAYVILEDIVFLKPADFHELYTSFGITSADHRDLSTDKFIAVLRAAGVSGEIKVDA